MNLRMHDEIAVWLHNVRSAHNVGSIFRTADAAGVSRIFLSGYAPLPVDAFGRMQKDIAKTALGAERFVPWEQVRDVPGKIARMKSAGWTIIGVEQDEQAADYRTLPSAGKSVFLFGNEVRGLSPALRARCDALVEIPMRGTKESLNVSVAAGIILFAALADQ